MLKLCPERWGLRLSLLPERSDSGALSPRRDEVLVLAQTSGLCAVRASENDVKGGGREPRESYMACAGCRVWIKNVVSVDA